MNKSQGNIGGISKNNFRTSYSALETFKQCPQKYKFRMIDNIRAPKTKEAVFGNNIHETLRFFHSKQPVPPTLDELLNYLKDIWPARRSFSEGGQSELFNSQEEEMIYFSEAIKMLKNYYQYFLKNKGNFTVLDTESRFEINIYNPSNTSQKCILVGKIDRIDKLSDGTIEVIDYKTAKRLPSQNEIDSNPQMSLYCLAVFLRWPHLKIKKSDNIKLSFHYLKHGEILSTKRNRGELEEAKNEIWERINEIEKEKFKPIPSALCDWCGYKSICPMWKHKFSEQRTVSSEQINKIINEFLKIKEESRVNNKKLNELKEVINNYLSKEGLERIFSDNGYITRSSLVRYKYDIDKLKSILEPLKKWQDIITVDTTKLNKLIKTLPKKIAKEIEKNKNKKEYATLKATITKKNGNNFPLQNK